MRKLDLDSMDGEYIDIDDYRQLYDEYEPQRDGKGFFVHRAEWLTDNEVDYDKVFNHKYTEENEYTHIVWYKDWHGEDWC